MKKSQVLSDNELNAEAEGLGFNVLGNEKHKKLFRVSDIGRMPTAVRQDYQTKLNAYQKQAIQRKAQGLPGIKPEFLQKEEQAKKEGFDRLV